jgi:hypothetical protein
MPESKKIFVSYNWKDSVIADEIDRYFLSIGFPLIRDIRELHYKSSIKDFMKKVRETDFVLMIISDSFLKSSNCMFEVLELVKENNFKSKLLQILLKDAIFFKPLDKLKYIHYWDKKYKELEIKISNIKTTDGTVFIKELKHIDNIRASIGEFLDFLTEQNCIPFYDLRDNNFKQVLDFIGYVADNDKNRPTKISADVFKFIIDEILWYVFVGLIDKKPVELFCVNEEYLYIRNIPFDFSKEVVLISNSHNTRIDLQFCDKNDGCKVTVEGINRKFKNTETYIFTRIIISLIKSNIEMNTVINILDEMYTQDYSDPYLWKDEMKRILNQYNNNQYNSIYNTTK